MNDRLGLSQNDFFCHNRRRVMFQKFDFYMNCLNFRKNNFLSYLRNNLFSRKSWVLVTMAFRIP